MKRIVFGYLASGVLALLSGLGASPACAQDTAFTYQGRLDQTGAPLVGSADLRFTLFDAATGGTALACVVEADGVVITDGTFSAPLDFGTALDGSPRWIEIAVRAPSGVGSFVTLSPRQPVTPAPMALTGLGFTPVVGPGVDQQSVTVNAYYGSTVALTQSFLPSVTGRLLSVTLYLWGDAATPTLTNVQVLDEAGTVLASVGITVPLGSATQSAAFATPPWLVAQKRYRLAVTSMPGARVLLDTGNPYPRGQLNTNAAYDMYFQTIMESTTAMQTMRHIGIGGAPANPLSVVGTADISGPLGIGTTTPANPLGVVGNADISGRLGIGTTTPANPLDVVGNADISGRLGIGTTSPANPLGVVGNADISGRLGIGTTSPQAALHVTGDILSDNGRTLQAKNTGGAVENWMWPRWTDNRTYTNFGTSGWYIRNNSSAVVMDIESNGNVGLGTTAPTALLDVRGDIKLSSSGALYATSSVGRTVTVDGIVQSNGTIAFGTGFTVSRTGVGRYHVAISGQFSTLPAFIVTPISTTPAIGYTNLLSNSGGVFTADVDIANTSGTAVDAPFCFIASGAR